MILQLNPPIWLSTPKGDALCHFLIDYGVELDMVWGCFSEDGEIWFWPNQQVRAIKNITMLRDKPENAYRIEKI